ncbi:MAG: hypothetical protein JST42_21370 [Bacteroidetes bacterium]|nr:hypothetical protein [Bacteroidota bacterium]
MKYLVLLVLFPMVACWNSNRAGGMDLPGDSSYMRTGFYFLSEGKGGVRMSKGDEYVYLAKRPFASVDNVSQVDIDSTGGVPALCIKFDPKGTMDIQDGTGNTRHPKLAVVIANKLLYVVENSAKITTGVMCVVVSDYSKGEIEEMKRDIEMKR